MMRFVLRTLEKRGFVPLVAHYEPYSLSPDLSTPAFKLLTQRPSERRGYYQGAEIYALGAWMPEFEVSHYWLTDLWKQKIEAASAHVMVAGNALAATAYRQAGISFLGWVASDWNGDRKDRVKKYPMARKIIDWSVVRVAAPILERRALRSGEIMALSEFTKKSLNAVAGADVVSSVLPMPIDTEFFCPALEGRVAGRIGFSGRSADPRKNVILLLQAVSLLRRRGAKVELILVGEAANELICSHIKTLNLQNHIQIYPHVQRHALRDLLRTFEVFALPSHQEGLCIAALEAMSCECPIVSTRCGGPEEFVLDGETGFLVRNDPSEMADSLEIILSNKNRSKQLGANARRLVEEKYAIPKAEEIFWQRFDHLYSTGEH